MYAYVNKLINYKGKIKQYVRFKIKICVHIDFLPSFLGIKCKFNPDRKINRPRKTIFLDLIDVSYFLLLTSFINKSAG